MKLGEAGAKLMHQWEGYRTKPYLCPAHIWTIGYGHVLYQEQIRLPGLAPALSGRQGAFDTCVSFSFNAGLGAFQRSSIRMKINRGDWEGAAEALMLYVMAGGKVLAGLKRRREAEKALFLS